MISFKELKRHKYVIQFIKYMIGGGVYFWVGLAIFSFCYSVLGWHWLVAKAMGDVIGWTLNYLIQRYWVFANPWLKKHEGRAATRYTIINALDFGIDYAIVIGLKSIGITPYIGVFVSSAFTSVWDYLWYRFWVFAPSKD